jgi:predicted GNAT superfamily acetyltransferase
MPDKEKLKQIEEEAMAEWLERGYDIKDFSLEKMQGILACYIYLYDLQLIVFQ